MKVYIGVFQHLLCIPSVCDIIEDYFDIFSALVFLVSEIVKMNYKFLVSIQINYYEFYNRKIES